MARYRLLVGVHVGPDFSARPKKITDPDTGFVTERYPSKTYQKGALIESELDLVEWGGHQKFARAGEEAPVRQRSTSMGSASPGDVAPDVAKQGGGKPFPSGQVPEGFQGESGPAAAPATASDAPAPAAQQQAPDDNFDSWTLADLKAYAAEEEIDLKGATKKEDVIRAIRGQGQGQAQPRG